MLETPKHKKKEIQEQQKDKKVMIAVESNSVLIVPIFLFRKNKEIKNCWWM